MLALRLYQEVAKAAVYRHRSRGLAGPPPLDGRDLPDGALDFPFGFNAVVQETIPS
jgi:hypothetical protein